MSPLRSIVLIEDSPEDTEAIRRSLLRLGRPNRLVHFANGEAALQSLSTLERFSWPPLVLLDLNLPGLDGREVLSEIKQNPSLCGVPVVVLTTSSNPHDLEHCYCKGASGYLIKPVDLERLQSQLAATLSYWLDTVALGER